MDSIQQISLPFYCDREKTNQNVNTHTHSVRCMHLCFFVKISRFLNLSCNFPPDQKGFFDIFRFSHCHDFTYVYFQFPKNVELVQKYLENPEKYSIFRIWKFSIFFSQKKTIKLYFSENSIFLLQKRSNLLKICKKNFKSSTTTILESVEKKIGIKTERGSGLKRATVWFNNQITTELSVETISLRNPCFLMVAMFSIIWMN